MVSVAVDGPVGAGKSTIARVCAKKLGFIYVDTGALYRACGLFCKRNSVEISLENHNAVNKLLGDGLKLEIRLIDSVQHVFMNGEDVSEEIRLPEISMAASAVSAIPEVRAFLLDVQRKMAEEYDVIMDGRDIGTVILPNATVKIFITAKPEIRAKRRFDELSAKGVEVKFEEVLNDLNKRDYQDSHRAVAPLKLADDAFLLDTTELDFDGSVQAVLDIINAKKGN